MKEFFITNLMRILNSWYDFMWLLSLDHPETQKCVSAAEKNSVCTYFKLLVVLEFNEC